MTRLEGRSAPSSTQGYAEQALALIERYESLTFATANQTTLPFIPDRPSSVIDIGAGTGRDAAALATRGHTVLAVEPTHALRIAGQALHASPQITWLNDQLPDLAKVVAQRTRFELVLMNAVLMHLDAQERMEAVFVLPGLMRMGARLLISLRHGPVPEGRRMFEVSAEEMHLLARAQGMRCILEATQPSVQESNIAQGVTWTIFVFEMA